MNPDQIKTLTPEGYGGDFELTMEAELDEILERYRLHANMAYSEVEDGFRTADEFKDVALPKVLDGAKQALVDWHNKQVLEIIGEDEPPEGLTSWYDGIERDSRHREGRNMLREWQRNKLKEAK